MKTLILLSFLFSISALAAPNPLCLRARIKSLVISHPTRYPNGIDLCMMLEMNTPLEFREAIMDVLDIHQRAASLLGVPMEKFLSRGIDIRVQASNSGLNGKAKARTRSIELTTVPNPKRWINRGIYAHELGHYLSFPDVEGTPIYLKSTYRSLFGETLADTIAIALVGTDTSPEKSVPACMSEPRVGLNQSYVAPFGEFNTDNVLLKLKKCCESHETFIADMRDYCDGVLRGEDGELYTLKPFDLEPFSIRRMSAKNMDEHRIGTPVNSFLKALSGAVSKNLHAELIKGLKTVTGQDFFCEMPNSRQLRSQVVVKAFSLKAQLQLIKSSLGRPDQKRFDELWKKHTLDIAVTLDEQDQVTRSETLARNSFIQQLGNRPDPCRGTLLDPDTIGHVAGCEIKCRK